MYTRVQHAMAQFVPKIEKLSHTIGTGPILETGFVPFFRNKFPGLNLIFHINPYNPKILMLILLTPFHKLHIFYLSLTDFQDFPGFPGPLRTLLRNGARAYGLRPTQSTPPNPPLHASSFRNTWFNSSQYFSLLFCQTLVLNAQSPWTTNTR